MTSATQLPYPADAVLMFLSPRSEIDTVTYGDVVSGSGGDNSILLFPVSGEWRRGLSHVGATSHASLTTHI